MRASYFCSFRPGRISGPSNSVTLLARQLEETFDVKASIFTTDKSVVKSFSINGAEILPFSEFKVHQCDFAVLAGLYDLNVFRAARRLKATGVPYILSPRSNLMRASFSKSRVKKTIALASYSGYVIRNAAALHFLSESERINSYNPHARYFVSRNGVDLSFLESGENTISCDTKYIDREKVILYIGRYDIHHKGLDLLITAIVKCQAVLREEGWKLKMYGPNSGVGFLHTSKLVAELGISDLVELNGTIIGLDKFSALFNARLFIHSSRYEGQPQAVIEAMSMGCVPIVTAGTNMLEHIKSHDLGWCAEGSSNTLAEKICSAIMSTRIDQLSRSCVGYARSNFAWPIAAREFMKGVQQFGFKNADVQNRN